MKLENKYMYSTESHEYFEIRDFYREPLLWYVSGTIVRLKVCPDRRV